jgi:hypothetical protein
MEKGSLNPLPAQGQPPVLVRVKSRVVVVRGLIVIFAACGCQPGALTISVSGLLLASSQSAYRPPVSAVR